MGYVYRRRLPMSVNSTTKGVGRKRVLRLILALNKLALSFVDFLGGWKRVLRLILAYFGGGFVGEAITRSVQGRWLLAAIIFAIGIALVAIALYTPPRTAESASKTLGRQPTRGDGAYRRP